MNYRAMIAPFVGVFAIILQLLFGIELGEELQSDITASLVNLVAVGAVLVGLVKANKK